MKHIVLPLLFCAATVEAQNTYDIAVSDFGFNPDSLTVLAGDSIRVTFYELDHTWWEVSHQTWLSDSSTQSGMFFEPNFIGHSFTVALPVPDTIYYVCGVHVQQTGEKGYVIVQPATSVQDHAPTSLLSLSPNPASSVVNVSLAMGDRWFVASVFDAQGRRVADKRIGAGPLTIDHLQPGAYTVVCFNDAGAAIAREPLVVVR